jgi:hypothetical protein
VSITPSAGWTSVTGFAGTDQVALYQLASFPQTWSGVHTFAIGDGNLTYYQGGPPAAGIASTEIPATLGGQLPVDFVWAGDTFADCWGQAKETAGGAKSQCRYANVCGAAGYCTTNSDCLALDNGTNTCDTSVAPGTCGAPSGSGVCVTGDACNVPGYTSSSGACLAFGKEPASSPAAAWAPVVGHYQALATLDGMENLWVRCDWAPAVPSVPAPNGMGPCQTFPWIDAAHKQPGYAALSYMIAGDGTQENFAQPLAWPASFPLTTCASSASCAAGYTCDTTPGDAANGYCVRQAGNTCAAGAYLDSNTADPLHGQCISCDPTPGVTTCGQGFVCDRWVTGACVPNLQGYEYAYWKKHHPEWLLYTAPHDSPERVATLDSSLQPFMNRPIFDVSNPAVTNEFVGRIEHWIGRSGTGYAPYGALSIDTVFLANYSAAHYVCTRGAADAGPATCGDCDPTILSADQLEICLAQNGWKIPSVTVNGVVTPLSGSQKFDPAACSAHDGYCDPAWTQMVLTWVGRLRDEAHSLGLDLAINVGYSGADSAAKLPWAYIPPDNPELGALFDMADGVLDEGGFTQGLPNALGDKNECMATWAFNGQLTCNGGVPTERDLFSYFAGTGATSTHGQGYMRAVQARGKAYFGKNGAADLPSEPTLSWVMASHLLARGAKSTAAREYVYLAAGAAERGYLSPWPGDVTKSAYDGVAKFASIGYPCEDLQTLPGYPNVFTRRYSEGWVVVNAMPSSSGALTIGTNPGQVPLPTPQPDSTWASYSSSIPAMSGAVIPLAAGALCGPIGSPCSADDQCTAGACIGGACQRPCPPGNAQCACLQAGGTWTGTTCL